MKITILLLCLLAATTVHSQASEDLRKKYDSEFIYRYGSSFMKGSDKLSFAMLQQEFKSPSLSVDLYKKAKSNKIISRVFRLASALTIFGVVKGLRDNDRNLAYGFIGGQLVTSFIGHSLYQRSVMQTDRALQIHNRELLFPGR